jgi:hypothetical protein
MKSTDLGLSTFGLFNRGISSPNKGCEVRKKIVQKSIPN